MRRAEPSRAPHFLVGTAGALPQAACRRVQTAVASPQVACGRVQIRGCVAAGGVRTRADPRLRRRRWRADACRPRVRRRRWRVDACRPPGASPQVACGRVQTAVASPQPGIRTFHRRCGGHAASRPARPMAPQPRRGGFAAMCTSGTVKPACADPPFPIGWRARSSRSEAGAGHAVEERDVGEAAGGSRSRGRARE
jgi:hypothetical protein